MSEIPQAYPYDLSSIENDFIAKASRAGRRWGLGHPPIPEDIHRIVGSGLVERFEAEADDKYTFVYSTDRESAQDITQNGFPFRDCLNVEQGLVEVVPCDAPNARTINTAALSYRRAPWVPDYAAKVVLQLPVPYPNEAYTNGDRLHPGFMAALRNTYTAVKEGVFAEGNDHSVFLHPRNIPGWIDMDTAEFHANSLAVSADKKHRWFGGLSLKPFGK